MHFKDKSSNSSTKVGCFIPEIVQVHSGKGQQNLLVLICFWRKLDTKLVRPGKHLIKAAIVNVADFPHFEIQVIKYGIVNVGAVATSKAWTEDTFLAVAAFDGVDDLLVFSWEDLNLWVGTCVITADPAPTAHSDNSQDSTGLVPYDELVLQARHILQAATMG